MSGIVIPLEEFTLDNGLRVVVSEDHVVPVVGVNLWYDVGSRDERPGRTGFAHLFEHMMFQGSTNVAKVEHMNVLEALGGSVNATTTLHRTNYFETAPAHALDLMLWLEADRLNGLLDALDQSTLDNQRDVVKNEKRQSMDNQPYGDMFMRMLRAVFPEGHPYHHAPIGSMEDLDAASLEDIHSFFRTHYVPNNAVLSVVGDVDAAEVRATVERYFGAIAPGDPPAPPDTARPAAPLGSVEEIPDDVPMTRVYAVFPAPDMRAAELDAAQVAATVLAGSEGRASQASRVHRALVRDRRLAQDVMLDVYPFPGTSMIVFMMNVLPGVDPYEAIRAFEEVLADVQERPPTPDEMQRARAGIQRSFLEAVSSSRARADLLSETATIYGDPGLVPSLLDRLLSIDEGRVEQSIATLFTPENRAALIYIPKEGS